MIDGVDIAQVTDHQSLGGNSLPVARREVVVDRDVVPTGHELADRVAADVPRAAGDQDSHVRSQESGVRSQGSGRKRPGSENEHAHPASARWAELFYLTPDS